MLKHLAQDLLAIVCSFGTVAVFGSILHQESQARLKRLRPKTLNPSVRPRQTIAAAQAASQPRPIQPEPVSPQVPAGSQSSIVSWDENTERPKRKPPEEREALRAEQAERRARHEERLQRKAERERQESV